MKNVMLLGDSIRLLYQPLVREKLKNKANVYGPEENGRWSGYTLNSLRFWLQYMPKPDIVHWNNGLWDMGDDYELGRPFSLPEEYVSALERTIRVLYKLCGENVKIIMATTTPTVDTDITAPHKYNELIKEVAARHKLEVNDLFSLVAADIPKYIGTDRIHLTPEGTELAASQAAACIEKYI